MDKKSVRLGVFSGIFSEILFGLSFLFTKNIMNTVSPFTLLSWRFLLAFAAIHICACFKLIQVDFRGKNIKPLLFLALVQPVLYFTLETFGIQRTTASESGLIISCIPIVALICSSVFLKEHPTRFQLSGILITTLGVVLVVLVQQGTASFQLFGYLLLFGAVTAAGLFFIFVQKSAAFNDGEKTYVIMAAGAIFFSVLALVEHGLHGTLREFLLLPFTQRDFFIAIAYLGIGSSVLAFFFANAAIAHLGTNRAASFIGITTLVSVLSGVLILKESFSPGQFLGMLLILAGVYLANQTAKAPD